MKYLLDDSADSSVALAVSLRMTVPRSKVKQSYQYRGRLLRSTRNDVSRPFSQELAGENMAFEIMPITAILLGWWFYPAYILRKATAGMKITAFG